MALLHQRVQSVRGKGLYFLKSLLQSLILFALLHVLLVVVKSPSRYLYHTLSSTLHDCNRHLVEVAVSFILCSNRHSYPPYPPNISHSSSIMSFLRYVQAAPTTNARLTQGYTDTAPQRPQWHLLHSRSRRKRFPLHLIPHRRPRQAQLSARQSAREDGKVGWRCVEVLGRLSIIEFETRRDWDRYRNGLGGWMGGRMGIKDTVFR